MLIGQYEIETAYATVARADGYPKGSRSPYRVVFDAYVVIVSFAREIVVVEEEEEDEEIGGRGAVLDA